MTCVAKEYQIKTKMRFLLVYNLKTFGGEGIKIWWLDFSRWGGMNKFMAGGGIPRFFQIAARGVEGGFRSFAGGNFVPDGGNLWRSGFDDSNLQS